MAASEREAVRRDGFLDGIDVSSIQSTIDWPAVADAGFRFAVMKASEGVSYVDPSVARNLAGARAAGLYVGVYAFARVSQGNPAAQAERLWTATGDTMPDLPPVLDLESAPDGMPAADIIAFGERFADELEARFGRPPMLYTYPSFAGRLQPSLAASRLTRCPLWIAQYWSTTTPWEPPDGFAPLIPSGWGHWVMHQYSGNGGFRVPGVSVDCDRNLYQGDEAAFRRFCGFPDVPSAA